jgi:hypothetical protein
MQTRSRPLNRLRSAGSNGSGPCQSRGRQVPLEEQGPRAVAEAGAPLFLPRTRWAPTASLLLIPNWELPERDRQVKRRWQALIAEARSLGHLQVEHVS